MPQRPDASTFALPGPRGIERPRASSRRWCRHAADTVAAGGRGFGTEVWLKHENHTPIGAFKARSAAMYFRRLMEREPAAAA
jgi:hypothetical protein